MYKKELFGCLQSILLLIGVIAIMIMFRSCTNSLYSDIWNNGVCSNCEIKYELRGVSDGLKYYICPECGQEVQRY